jgi:MFS family permease
MVKIKSKKRIELRHKARRLSIKEGCFASIKTSLGDAYITPFAIAINSSNFLIGMISSISGLVGPISQWFSSRLIERYKRKNIILTATLYEGLTWIPLILISFLFYKGILTSLLPLLLLIFFSLYVIIANITSPAWFSWTGDLVDENYRGKWFSKRNFALGFVSIIFTILAAFFLDFLKKQEAILFGFIILFFLAMVARFISRSYFKKIYEPKLKLKKGYYFSFWQFIKKSPKNNFGRFVLFRTLMDFTICIASPFFTVYMLRNLNFSYTTFMLVVLSQTFFGLLTMKQWGKFADKYGNYETMKLTIILISIFPALWLISDSPIFLIFVPQLVGGIGWAGFNLAAGNFIYDSVSPQKRGLVVSYHNVLNGIGIFLGAGLGAILVKTLTITFMDKLLFIFLISSFARLTAGLIMLPCIKEVRKIKKFDSKRAIKSLIPKRIKLPIFEGTHEFLIRKEFMFRR